MGGRAHKRTRAPSGRADGLEGGQTGKRVDGGGHAGRTSRQGRTMGKRADGRTGGRGRVGARTGGRVGGLADWWTCGQRISEGKTPNLMRHLTWPWEIQCGRPRVTVKLPDLPPPSR